MKHSIFQGLFCVVVGFILCAISEYGIADWEFWVSYLTIVGFGTLVARLRVKEVMKSVDEVQRALNTLKEESR